MASTMNFTANKEEVQKVEDGLKNCHVGSFPSNINETSSHKKCEDKLSKAKHVMPCLENVRGTLVSKLIYGDCSTTKARDQLNQKHSGNNGLNNIISKDDVGYKSGCNCMHNNKNADLELQAQKGMCKCGFSGESSKVEVVDGVHGNSTFFQATLNCLSLLYGLGILSSPYAVAQAGWMGAVVSVLIATAYAYAAWLMGRCVSQNYTTTSSYQDIARHTFTSRRTTWVCRLITALFYIEITGTLMGYCISIGDNLDYIFSPPTPLLARFSSALMTSPRTFMVCVASLLILPSVWVRDLSALAFTSMWCIATSVLLLIAVFIAATLNGIGFTHPIPFLRLPGIPVAAGLYAFSYGGTSVFPSIYKSMKNPSRFPYVLLVSFSIATASIVGLGVTGAAMFGPLTASQITLSMPRHLLATRIVLWMTVLTPIAKFALQLSPITTALEARLYHCLGTVVSSKTALHGLATLLRSATLALIVVLSMILPYFQYIVALVGSSMTIAICMILPCIFFLKLYWNKLGRRYVVGIGSLIAFGVVVGTCGTVVAMRGLIMSKLGSSGN